MQKSYKRTRKRKGIAINNGFSTSNLHACVRPRPLHSLYSLILSCHCATFNHHLFLKHINDTVTLHMGLNFPSVHPPSLLVHFGRKYTTAVT